MGNEIAIRIEGLGKRYRLGQTVDLKRTFRETLMDLPRFFGHKAARTLKNAAKRTLSAARVQELQAAVRDHRTADPETPPGTFWALRDINLEIKHGEVVGIIGRNGAGKSTLLKILSRVTDPTTGHAEIHGRIASLLEVGTGFSSELTGRENIYLNGSILGMRKAEIDRQFDEIVAFAEVEKFLDTPVKRYSSGMYVRLAFAVAAHLEPEILIVDEVLSVGDAQFQKKCLGRMGKVAKEGRTVLFVSHNMIAVRNLCGRCVLLHDGSILQNGETGKVVDAYHQASLRAESSEDVESLIRALPADPDFRLEEVSVTQDGIAAHSFVNGKPIKVEIRYAVARPVSGLRVYFDVLDDNQDILIRTFHDEQESMIPVTRPGRYVSVAEIPAKLLAPRMYDLRICAGVFNVRSCMGDGILIPLNVETTSGINRAYPWDTHRAKMEPEIRWNTVKVSCSSP